MRMSRNGKTKTCMNGQGCPEEKYDWQDTIIDGGIMSAIAAGSTYASLIGTGIPDLLILRACLIAAFIAFFAFVSVKRGLGPKKEG